MVQKKYKTTIIGMGRFGRLLYDQLAELGGVFLELSAVTSRPQEHADINIVSFAEAKQSDIIIPAMPISAFEQNIKNLAEGINPEALVIDVCSVKVKPIEWMRQYLPETVQICGTHPLWGPDSVRINGGLKGLPIIICAERLSPKFGSMIFKLLEITGLRGVELTPDQHDEKMAWSLLYFQLIGRIGDTAGVKDTGINTVGFSKLLDLQQNYALNDSWQLFSDMYHYNPYGPEMLNKVKESINVIEKKLHG